ncbi:cilia- and flagella-associated protein 221 isoform X2 [Gouania willdenowi]|uniref:cilia- and flagella-associated protein 221 isoform X2 n=1 Tax=Gouania willdenowi TaxID=441366 RepID=UPI0010550FE6|nr:cilia- and flagella-associated protein 221 isoform X2 [Gouania willdenowi]
MQVSLSETPRRGTPLPLSQLVEESRSGTSIPNPLLQSKFYDKLKSNNEIQAEPPELHFSGFELGKEYFKLLKLINISSEVINIHIIPTQTKHFQTTYTKKYRLIPGLAYTLKVAFRPDEWRYFYDCVRVHCRGEENLLIPLHGYPVIDDLCIPSHVDLSAVPIGHSVQHVLPLRCSCPIDFQFQVYVVEQHEAFSIRPLSGVIPANGQTQLTVTFSPVQYETCQLTIQLVVSQFNTKPFLCSITGSSVPHLTLRPSRAPPAVPVPPPRVKAKPRVTREKHRLKTVRNPAEVKPPVDACTPAGVAKMLIKDEQKVSSEPLMEVMKRETKAALFLKKVQKNVKEEQKNHLRSQVRLGEDPMTESSRRLIMEQREVSPHHEFMVKMEDESTVRQTKLSCKRQLHEAGKAPEGTPTFQFYTSFHLELRQRALRRFQQAARQVVLRCRLSHTLSSLQKLRNEAPTGKAEETTPVFPSSFPFFTSEDPLSPVSLVALPVDPIDVNVNTDVPFLQLQVSPHYELMGYKPVSIWGAFTSYIPPPLIIPLHTDTLHQEQEQEGVPEALLEPFPANPLRVFNPAPDLQTHTSSPTFPQSTVELQLCPRSRYDVSKEQNLSGTEQEVIPVMTTWRDVNRAAVPPPTTRGSSSYRRTNWSELGHTHTHTQMRSS